MTHYETRPGDTPSVIAKEQLGDRDLWADIVVWNAGKCGFMGPNDWYRNGTILRLPEVAAMTTIDKLIERMRCLETDHLAEGWPAVRMQQITMLLDEIEAMRQERDGLRTDAVRYRWLRDVAWDDGSLIFFDQRYDNREWDEKIDERIEADKAMAKEQGDES